MASFKDLRKSASYTQKRLQKKQRKGENDMKLFEDGTKFISENYRVYAVIPDIHLSESGLEEKRFWQMQDCAAAFTTCWADYADYLSNLAATDAVIAIRDGEKWRLKAADRAAKKAESCKRMLKGI